MSTVAPEVRGAQPAPTPPVRHGTCRLTLTIDGTEYRLSQGISPIRAVIHAKQQDPSPPSLAAVPSNGRLAGQGPAVSREGCFSYEMCLNNPSQESKSRQLILVKG